VLIDRQLEEGGCTGDCDVCRRLRQALLAALAWDEDPHALAAADLAERAELPETELLAHYGSVDNCLAATYDELSEELYELQLRAFDGSGDWQSRFLDGMRAALDHIDSTPGASRLFFADDLLAFPGLRTRRAAAQQRVARLVSDEVEHEQERGIPAVQIEFILGAVAHAAKAEVADGMEPARVVARVGETLRVLEPLAA
jgi:AcrR family transcriptional regulator